MSDMLGAILSVVATPLAPVSDNLVIIETEFKGSAPHAVQAHFWVLPDPALPLEEICA
jgi:hypothetical protein